MTQPRVLLHEIVAALDNIAAFSLAEAWDNVGLLVGDPDMPVTGIMVALDPTEAALEEAVAHGANVLVTHHPIIFQPLKAMRTDQPVGQLVSRALRDNLAVISCHTNLDLAGGGVNDVLAARLGLAEISELSPAAPASLGRIGTYQTPLPAETFLARVMDSLATPVLSIAGELPNHIARVAVCGGSGSELAASARQAGCHAFITSEVKLSTARWAQMAGLCIIDAGHYPTENVIVPILAAELHRRLGEKGHAIEVTASNKQKNPFTHVSREKQAIVFHQ